jgi:hypothetical protein
MEHGPMGRRLCSPSKLEPFWERNAAEGAFDENPDMWTSWLFAFTFFEIVEAKRGDVERAFQENLLYLSN